MANLVAGASAGRIDAGGIFGRDWSSFRNQNAAWKVPQSVAVLGPWSDSQQKRDREIDSRKGPKQLEWRN